MLATPLGARQRAPLVDGLDLGVPMAPAAVRVGGTVVLAHEVHITSFLRVDAVVLGLDVVHGESGAMLARYERDDLRARLGRPGLGPRAASPYVIAPGMRAVAYLWIELPDAITMPASVRHRLDVEIRRPGGAVRATIEGGAASVATAAPIALAPPLRGGPWVAIYDPLLMGGHRTAIYAVDGRARIPARFAIDFIRPSSGGAIAAGVERQRPGWNGYGEDVLAVADGVVASAFDDIAENTDPPAAGPMPPEIASGNYVSLDLGGGRFAFYEHLRRGSVTVKAGDRVKRGDVIGRLGNSGSSSIGPHLHFHVSDRDSPLGAEGLPFVFTEFEHLGRFTSIGALVRGDTWVAAPRASWIALEHPAANAVVRFR